MIESKICIKCGKELPATKEYFNERKDGKTRFRNECKICKSEYNRKHRLDNIEQYKEYDRKHYESNSEQIKQRQRNYNAEHKAEIAQRDRKYIANHREEIAQRKKQYYDKNKDYFSQYNKLYWLNNKESLSASNKIYREEHKEELRQSSKRYWEENKEARHEYRKKYYKKNKDACLQRTKEWVQENREHVRNYNAKRRSKQRQLSSTLTRQQWQYIKNYFGNRCAYCGKERPLQQEHFIPLSKDGEYTHNNIICACQSCNVSKLDRDFFIWYPKQSFHNKKREAAILKFLGYSEQGTQQPALMI